MPDRSMLIRVGGSIFGLLMFIVSIPEVTSNLQTWGEWIGDSGVTSSQARWGLAGIGLFVVIVSNFPTAVWRRFGIARETSAPVAAAADARQAKPIFADYDHARWFLGGLYVNSRQPYSQPPVCPVHLTRLWYHDARTDEVNDMKGEVRFRNYAGEILGTWHCLADGGHDLAAPESRDFDESRNRAEAVLLGEYNKQQYGHNL